MRSGAVKIAVIYTISGLLWIILSDKLLDLMKGSMDASFVLFLSSIKGFFYVLVTGIILYKLILKHDSRLEESEKQYRSYFEANPSPMWIYNRRTLNFTAVNNAAVAKYGYTPEEFFNMTVLDIRPKSDVAVVHTAIKNLTNAYNDSGVWTHLKKDGTAIRVRITSHGITSGKEQLIMVMATDVTGTDMDSE
ncbi:PAS domain S-box protein [Mucilaginibacter corticis]|uniref:PAS domain S-box protein n=1 Tax=Mucilaginibacter corticis TaxID=2597670 RepID=A0A556MS28_9SPHI|nr:PAS domain S-box protein [Mucilaginibacter corticis]TSJ42687.1 PAS domain S-box protein [Mucilaginibacter corticis]